MNWITRDQVGIVTVVVGTVLLAVSVKVKRQYNSDLSGTVDKLKEKSPNLVEVTETYISRPLFWSGLTLVAIGSMLQW